jgi:hypothetical protein
MSSSSYTLRLGIFPSTILQKMQSMSGRSFRSRSLLVMPGAPLAPRIAYGHDVSLNLNNSGTWETLGNGDRIWRLRVETPGSYSIMLVYDRWVLPKGAQLFLYNDDHSDVRGAFTLEQAVTPGAVVALAS